MYYNFFFALAIVIVCRGNSCLNVLQGLLTGYETSLSIVLMPLYETTGDHLQKNIRLCLKLIIAADVTSMTCCESTNLLQWSESEGLMRAQDGEIEYIQFMLTTYKGSLVPLSLRSGVFVSSIFPCTLCLRNKRKQRPVSSVLWPTLKQQRQNKSGHNRKHSLFFFPQTPFFPLATIIVRDLYFVLSGVSLGPSSVQSILHFTSYLCQHLSAFIVPAASGN